MIKHIKNFFNGMAFGIVETVPGVSGGTIAIILGFYDKLIHSINNFKKDTKSSLKFLVPLAIGMVFGILLFGKIINYLLTHFSLPTMIFFIGLIVGIIPLIYGKVINADHHRIKLKEFFLIGIPILILVCISHVEGLSIGDVDAFIAGLGWLNMLFLVGAGMVAAAALVIPGISGSFVLLLLGVYPVATATISAVSTYLLNPSNTPLLLDIVKVAGPLGLGIIIGGLLMVRLIENLLENHHKVIYSIILGLLIGSIYALFRNDIVYQSGVNTILITISVITFAIGCVTSYFFGRKKF
ncbi:MAG: DUF368 domain-containing protein [Oscillospiraceae bacterium]|nr:DUF368 domain-containing protein [Oscillospiraceae bacterium]